jgi:hypothetical protein
LHILRGYSNYICALFESRSVSRTHCYYRAHGHKRQHKMTSHMCSRYTPTFRFFLPYFIYIIGFWEYPIPDTKITKSGGVTRAHMWSHFMLPLMPVCTVITMRSTNTPAFEQCAYIIWLTSQYVHFSILYRAEWGGYVFLLWVDWIFPYFFTCNNSNDEWSIIIWKPITQYETNRN